MSSIQDAIINEIDPDSVEQLSILEQEIDKQVQESVEIWATVQSGHIYPVMLVQNWTKELQGYNNQINNFVSYYQQLNFDGIDRNWLRKKIQNFVTWINNQLAKLRIKIINSIKAMSQQVNQAIETISSIVNFSLSIDSIVGWASHVINYFTGPYGKLMQFITDFTTYTPPLIAEVTGLAANITVASGQIIDKTQELQGEGSDVIKEEISNAVGGITFEPISIGDLR